MKNKDKLISQVVNGFQENKGKASVYCFSVGVIPELVYSIITPFCKKHPNRQIFIVVDSYNTRKNIYSYLKSKDADLETGYDVKILSADYVKSKFTYNYELTITVGVNDNLELINKLSNESRFTLAILTKNIMNNDFIHGIRGFLPSIETADLDIAIRRDNIYSPVEEWRQGVELSDEDRELYDKYSEYITTSVTIFGSLDNIEKCKTGDAKYGISAATFRNNIAHQNGWREDLDTTIPIMKQIDDIYNPNILLDRAHNFYTIAKQRRDLVTDNKSKLDKIYQICCDNRDKRILIVSRRGEYAAKITEYINNRAEIEKSNLWCRDYHDCLDARPLVKLDGHPVLYKSGERKGQPVMAAWQKQSSINEALFNAHSINILSIKSSSNPKLKIAVDVVILTSSLCDIIDVKMRFANVTFDNAVTKVYRLYCIGTIENEKLNKEIDNPIIKVMNDTENFVGYDEFSGNIVL